MKTIFLILLFSASCLAQSTKEAILENMKKGDVRKFYIPNKADVLAPFPVYFTPLGKPNRYKTPYGTVVWKPNKLYLQQAANIKLGLIASLGILTVLFWVGMAVLAYGWKAVFDFAIVVLSGALILSVWLKFKKWKGGPPPWEK